MKDWRGQSSDSIEDEVELIRLKIIGLYKYVFYNIYCFMVRLYNGCVLAVIEWKMMDRIQLKPVRCLNFNEK